MNKEIKRNARIRNGSPQKDYQRRKSGEELDDLDAQPIVLRCSQQLHRKTGDENIVLEVSA